MLGVYSHMIDAFLYLPDYPIGHLIAFQIEEQMKKAGAIGPEFERMAKMGAVTPDLWMENATDEPVGSEALLEAAQSAFSMVTERPLSESTRATQSDLSCVSTSTSAAQVRRPVNQQRHNDQISQPDTAIPAPGVVREKMVHAPS